ncbi:DUF2177 family protein [Reyranella sp.]|uniref:DUF2177 family protein n=1 Tax=Reyranella sp. TaxID=1929291 RepID=UPI004037309F
MKTVMASYAVALGVLAVIDGLWLGVVAREFYKSQLGNMLQDKPIWSVAILFYLVHAAGVAVFAVPPSVTAGTWTSALLYGALFGFCVYGAYDFTNLAALRGWPWTVSVVDLAWGTAATAIATVIAFLVVKP